MTLHFGMEGVLCDFEQSRWEHDFVSVERSPNDYKNRTEGVLFSA
jgi:hypothetical protein